MSTRTTLRPQLVMDAVDISVDQTSKVTVLNSLTGVSFGISWAGTTPVGALEVQASNTYELGPTGNVLNAGTDWTTLSLEVKGMVVQAVTISGNAGTAMIDLTKTSVFALRLVYTASSGTGTLSATVTGKVA